MDDGSQDHTKELVESWLKEENPFRIHYVLKENGGKHTAINKGVELAQYEWFFIVDSDDYLEPDVYGYMLKKLQEQDADAVQFSFRDVYTNHTEPQILTPCVLNEREFLLRFTKDWSCPLLWNKLYKRSLFDAVFFEEGHKIDDEYFTYQGFLNPCKVVLDDRIIYNYRKRASSVMSSPEAGAQRILDCIDSIAKRREKVVARWPELRRAFDENYLDVIWYLSENYGMTEQYILVLKAHLKAYFREKGNTLPPRFLWLRLLKFWLTPAKKRAQECDARQETIDPTDYFA